MPDPAYVRGDEAADAGDLKRAERLYGKADADGDPTAAAKLGVLLEHRGATDEAMAAYRRADERGDGFGTLRVGLLLASIDRWEEAEEAFARAAERGTEQKGLDLPQTLGEARETPPGPSPLTGPAALANPVLVGAVTVLVAMVAVFLAYNANQGLPFVPTRQLKVNMASGSDLVIGDAVNEGGYRVGLVSAMTPITLRSGQVAAQLTLQLNESNGRVPVDSHAEVRPRSILGLKYVDLQVGASRHDFADGGHHAHRANQRAGAV